MASNNLIDITQVIEIFSRYCEYNKVKISREDFINNLEQKKDNLDFKSDMSVLLPSKLKWNFDESYHFVIANVISRLS